MVAPFLVPLRKWIKRNKKGKKQKASALAVDTKPSTPVPEIEPDQPATQDLDSTSKALKLLLGVGTEVSVTNEPSAVAKNVEPEKIDLANLFKSAKPVQRADAAEPIQILNSRLHDSSIAPQLQHAPPTMFHSPHIHQQLPPWMVQQSIHPGQMPLPPPNLHHGPRPYSNGNGYSSSPPKRPNPNAQSLLSILQPRAPPVASPERPVPTSNPPDHKQSLLSLLQPREQTVMPPPQQPPARDNEAFLMQYLLQATESRR